MLFVMSYSEYLFFFSFFCTSKALIEVQSCDRAKRAGNICALFGEEAFKASGRRREDGRELGRKRMRSEREVKTPSRPNNNSAQRWRMEE